MSILYDELFQNKTATNYNPIASDCSFQLPQTKFSVKLCRKCFFPHEDTLLKISRCVSLQQIYLTWFLDMSFNFSAQNATQMEVIQWCHHDCITSCSEQDVSVWSFKCSCPRLLQEENSLCACDWQQRKTAEFECVRPGLYLSDHLICKYYWTVVSFSSFVKLSSSQAWSYSNL